MSAVGKPGGSQSFGVWVSREEWKRQQVEMKRGTEAYNQVLQEIEKKDRTIEALRSSNEEAAAARHNAEEKAALLQMEVDKVHNELIEWQRLIEHQRAAITLQETKVETAASTVDAVTHRHDTVESRCRQLEEDVAAKEKTISNLHSREQNALEQLRAVEHLHHRSQKACAELEARVVLLERQCAGMSEQLSERMTEINDLKAVTREQSRVQSELDRVQTDNARLVKMLSSTREYAEFVQRAYAQSDVAYVEHGSPLVDLRIITEDYGANKLGETDRPLGDPKSEFAHWVPADILSYAQECRSRYLPRLTDESFGNFMHAMHLRWRAHEQRVLNRRELVHDREKQDLYRQVSHRKPHDVTKLEARVRHLRGQLRSSSGGKAGTAAAAAGSSGGGGGAGAAARLGEHSTQQSKEKLLAWSLETVEQLAKNQAS